MVQNSQIFIAQIQHSFVAGLLQTSQVTTNCGWGLQCSPRPSNSSSSISSPPGLCVGVADHTPATKGRGAMDHWSLNGYIASQPLPRLRRLGCTESAAPWPRHRTPHAGEGLTAPHKLAVPGRTQQQYHLDRDDAVSQAYDRPAKGSDQLLNASGLQVVMQVTDHTSKLSTFRKSLADTFSWTPRHAYSCCPSRSCSCVKCF